MRCGVGRYKEASIHGHLHILFGSQFDMKRGGQRELEEFSVGPALKVDIEMRGKDATFFW